MARPVPAISRLCRIAISHDAPSERHAVSAAGRGCSAQGRECDGGRHWKPDPSFSRMGEGFPASRAQVFPARRLSLRALSHVRGSGAPRGAGSISASVSYGRGADGLSHHPHAPWRSARRRFESSGPRFCRAGVSRRGLASSSRRDHSVPRSVPEASRERGATLARRRRTHPAKRHASGRPPLGDGMRGIIREVLRVGISLRPIPAARGNRDRTPLPGWERGRGEGSPLIIGAGRRRCVFYG
jgi:hypothetical protein